MRRLIATATMMAVALGALMLIEPITRTGEALAFDKKGVCCAGTGLIHTHQLNDAGDNDGVLAGVGVITLICAEVLGTQNVCNFWYEYQFRKIGSGTFIYNVGPTIVSIPCGHYASPYQVIAQLFNNLTNGVGYESEFKVKTDTNCDGYWQSTEPVDTDVVSAIP